MVDIPDQFCVRHGCEDQSYRQAQLTAPRARQQIVRQSPRDDHAQTKARSRPSGSRASPIVGLLQHLAPSDWANLARRWSVCAVRVTCTLAHRMKRGEGVAPH